MRWKSLAMDPLSVTSALIAIVTATVQSGHALHQAIQSFRNHQTTVAQLLRELRALNKVLQSLEVHIRDDETAFLPLKFPLIQCCQACTDFQILIAKCSKRSTGDRTSFRDWARLSYMNGDIVSFTNMLASYKLTINIALADANLRSSKVTLQVLNEYKDMIHDTNHDLKAHLRDINLRLETLVPQGRTPSTAATTNFQRIENERESTKKCLEICSQVLERINTMQFQPVLAQPPSTESTPVAISAQSLTVADAITLSTLTLCSTRLSQTIFELQAHKETTENNLPPDVTNLSNSLEGDLEIGILRLRGELDSTKQRLALCERASAYASSGRVHTVENIAIGDDGKQLCVSTLGDLFNIMGATAGHGAMQFFGSTSEASLLEILRAVKTRQPVHNDDAVEDEFCMSGGGSSSAI